MPDLSARTAAQIIALGRIAYGSALVLAPERVGGAWVGAGAAAGAGTVALRGLGVRDVLMGAISLHTLDDVARGHRWIRTAGLADAVDALATGLAASRMPRQGAAAGLAVAGGTAVASFLVSRRLHEQQTA